MALIDALKTAALGFGRSRLTGNSRTAADLLINIYKRTQMGVGVYKPQGRTGTIDPLAAARARKDPLLGIDWYCQLPVLPGVSAQPNSLGWEMVEEANLPLYEFEPQSNYRAGKMYHYPSHQNLGSLTLKLYEDVSGQSSAYIKNWQALMFDPNTGLYNPPSQFKLPITITLFDSAKFDVLVMTYTGCWPQTQDPFALTGGASERVIPGITFSVDDMYMSFAKLTSAQAESALLNTGKEFPNMQNTFPNMYPSF